MIGEDLARRPIADDVQANPGAGFEVAMDDLIAATMALTSALREPAFLKGARLRGVVERALSYAHVVAEQLSEGRKRSDALLQLAEMHGIVSRLLMIAPAPSAAAIARVEAGDPSLWNEEARAWIAGWSARGGRQNIALRPSRDKGRGVSWCARDDAPEVGPETGVTALPPDPSPPLAPQANKAGVQ